MSLFTKSDFWNGKFEVIDENSLRKPSCYACSTCNKCVSVNKVVWQNGKRYCWKCFEKAFSIKCVFCHEFIQGSNEMKFILYDNKVWHNECFSKSEKTMKITF